MTNEKVSVIIPVYNREEYIEQCISSITAQTYAALEILIVNDGSTDGTGAICDRLARGDERIRVVHQENAGVSAARNAALDICSGAWILYVDSDDYLHETCVETLLASAREHQTGLAQCFSVTEDLREKKYLRERETTVLIPAREMLMGVENQYTVWAKIYRRELWDGIRFPVGLLSEDVAVLYKVIYRAQKVALVPRILYYSHVPDEKNLDYEKKYNLSKLSILPILEEKMHYFEAVNEREIFLKTRREYILATLEQYIKVGRYLSEREIRKDLRRRYRRIPEQWIRKSGFSFKAVVLLEICRFFPDLWGIMIRKEESA